MENTPLQPKQFRQYFKQYKQRVDLDIEMSSVQVLGTTKLSFTPKESQEIAQIPLNTPLELKWNVENTVIKGIFLYTNNAKHPLSFNNNNPYYLKSYLNHLYLNVEDMESFRNINRVEWEIRNDGNVLIIVPPFSQLGNIDLKKVKILIEYELIENDIGIVFNSYYDERINSEHKVCFTPNFYCNTQNWVPCIYDWSWQVWWRLYLCLPEGYIGYSSMQIVQVYKGKNNKKLFINNSNEPITARNVGFVVWNDKIFSRVIDQGNKNIVFIVNENKKENWTKNWIENKWMSTWYSFYDEFFDINETGVKSNLNHPTIIAFLPYIPINSSLMSSVKYYLGKDTNYFNLIKFPNWYILPDKWLYISTIPEVMKYQLQNLSKIFITNYIGGLITEMTFADFWIISGWEEWLSDLFMSKAFGANYLKSKFYSNILTFKKICKQGKETHPWFNNNFTHPIELQLDRIALLKSKIVIHWLESQVEKIFIQKALKNILNERSVKGYNISTESWIKIFKKNCGVNLKHFITLWVYKTGMWELNLNYTYNPRTNSIDIEWKQGQVAKKYYSTHPFYKIKDIDVDWINKMGKTIEIIDYRIKPNRYFDVYLNWSIFQTNGIEIMRDSHQLKLENEKENYYQNFPWISKMRKMPLKKREQDFIQDWIMNTSLSKIYSNEDIEKIFTQNSIWWLRIDSDISAIRVINVKQQHIWYEYIKIFREGDIIGQMESWNNIKKDKENYTNSLNILKTFIEGTSYYKLRQYAVKIYVKIILKLKYDNEYQFLIDHWDDCYNEILRNKTSLNYETYYVMKEIIKQLGKYREFNFNSFTVLGLVTNSQIHNKIIHKFLAILVSNELNTITGFNDCYIMSEILIYCSRWNWQENSFILLKKILKNLRIEKLKRSYNEIVIVSSIWGFLNIMIKNDFYPGKKEFTDVINEILLEINFYIDNDCENFTWNVYLEYFQIVLIYYKSRSYIEFSHSLKYYILGKEYSNPLKCIKQSIEINLSFVAKIKGLGFWFEEINFTFNTANEKIECLSWIKEILYSPKCYNHIDCRSIMGKIYQNIFNKEIAPAGAGNNNFANTNFMHVLNKNWANYTGKKYADEKWWNSFIHEDQLDINRDDWNYSDNSSETHSRIGFVSNNTQWLLLKKYQSKYPHDSYAVLNCEVNTENKNIVNICDQVIQILLGHPLSLPFSYELNAENWGDIYEQYISAIKTPIDWSTIKTKTRSNKYKTYSEFSKDVLLVFSNAKHFNEEGSELYMYALQWDEYFKWISEPLKKLKLTASEEISNENNKINTYISIAMDDEDVHNDIQTKAHLEANKMELE